MVNNRAWILKLTSPVDRAVLIAIIAELQAVIERLQRRIAELEGQTKPGDPLRMPGLKAKSARKPPAQQQPRKQRRHGFARPRMTPTHRVEHVMENCPDCGAHLSGGWTQRTREVIELPVVPVHRARLPCSDLPGLPTALHNWTAWSWASSASASTCSADRHAAGRGAATHPQRPVGHRISCALGAIVSAIDRAAGAVAAILDRIRASPVVHADETGWREDGANGYVWTFSTTERYFLRRGRGKAVVDEALGESFSGVLVSDFYAAYHHYDGPKQRCCCCGTYEAQHSYLGGINAWDYIWLTTNPPALSTGQRRHPLQGTESKMTLASIFGTWRAQGLNPLAACRQLLVSPRL